MSKFVAWHCHSEGSVRDGILKIEDIIAYQKENNALVTLTDHGNCGLAVDFFNKAKKAESQSIIGMEIYINNSRDRLFDVVNLLKNDLPSDIKNQLKEERDRIKYNAHLVVVAKNTHGFYNIVKLNNIGFKNFYRKPLITYKDLFDLPKDENGDRGIFVSSACLAGTLPQLIMNNMYDEAVSFVEMMKNELGDNFFIEVQSNGIEEQKTVNKILLDIAEKTNTKVLIGMDAHYKDKENCIAHRDLLLIQNKNTIDDIDKVDIRIVFENEKGETKVKKFRSYDDDYKAKDGQILKVSELSKGMIFETGVKIKRFEKIIEIEESKRTHQFSTNLLYLKTEEELRKEVNKIHKELTKHIDTIINNHYELSEKFETIVFNTDNKLPEINNAYDLLKIEVAKGLKRFNLDKNKEYIERVKIELQRIKENNFSSYFLILKDALDEAKRLNVPIANGRGSSGGSVIAYLLGIIRVDGLKWGLYFDRFLAPERNVKKVFAFDGKNTLTFNEEQEIKVIRKSKETMIKANKLQKNDEIIIDE